jgi:hypothetical protein
MNACFVCVCVCVCGVCIRLGHTTTHVNIDAQSDISHSNTHTHTCSLFHHRSVCQRVVPGAAGLVAAFVRQCNTQLASVDLGQGQSASEADVRRAVITARVTMVRVPHARASLQ